MGQRDSNTITVTGYVEAEPVMQFTADGVPHTTLFLRCVQPTPRDPQAHERFHLIASGELLANEGNDLLPAARVLITGRLQANPNAEHTNPTGLPFVVIVRDLILLSAQPPALVEADHTQRPSAQVPPDSTRRPPAQVPPDQTQRPPALMKPAQTQRPSAPPVVRPTSSAKSGPTPAPTPPAMPRMPRGPRRAG